MKKHILTFCFLALFIGMQSCKDFLDTKPKDFLTRDAYYETEEQLNTALTGVYNILRLQPGYGNFMLGRMGLDADEGYDSGATRVTGSSVYYVSDVDADILNYWLNWYTGINRADILLENIDRPQMDETKRQQIRGEAIFLKAYYYFMLVTRFGDIPYLPKPVTSSKETQIARTPSAQVYENIVRDMKEAESLVPEIDQLGYGGRISKSAVQGMLSRVYLYWAGYPVRDISKYEDAKYWAEKVILSGKHDLNPDYKQIFINYAQDKYDIKESIWEVEFWGDGSGSIAAWGRVGSTLGIPSSNNHEKGYVNAYMRINGWLYRLYNAADVRRDWNVAPFSYSGTPAQEVYWASNRIYDRFIGKWRREYELIANKTTTATPQNYPLLRYSDVLLMYAEAVNELTTDPVLLQKAYEAINKVRRRGFGRPVNVPNADADLQIQAKDLFLKEIQNERSREFCFECMRKNDLVRWGIFLTRMKAVEQDYITDKPTSREYGILGFQNATERDVLWPIPAYEMTLNKLLTQNKGW